MKIRMDVEGEIVTATLDDTAAARDFAALLPLSLTLKDYAVIERIANLPRKLTTTGAPAGMKPAAGDITYYAPWGNLAIFVGGDVYARGPRAIASSVSWRTSFASSGSRHIFMPNRYTCA